MRTPPMMERTTGDDLKVAAGCLVGVALACLVGIADWTALLPAAFGITVATVIINLVRRARRRA